MRDVEFSYEIYYTTLALDFFKYGKIVLGQVACLNLTFK